VKHIMIIDDDQQFRHMLKTVLESSGYEISEAPNGAAAFKRMECKPADLIIVDILMPEMDGLETIIRMRDDYPFVKVVAVSGGGRIEPDNYLRSAEKLGALRTFTKPFDNQQLLTAVREMLC